MSSDPIQTDDAGFARSIRVMVAALMGALPMILVVGSIVILGTDGAMDFNPLALGIQVAAGLAAHLAIEQIGYRAPALEPSAPTAQARGAWQSAMILRFAVAESIAIASLAAAFVLDGGFFILLGGVVVSMILLVIHVWPNPRNVDRVVTRLEANGARTGLREAFGHSPQGPVQRL